MSHKQVIYQFSERAASMFIIYLHMHHFRSIFLGDDLVEFPRDQLVFVEKLGEGQFGEVQLCDADASLRQLVKADE